MSSSYLVDGNVMVGNSIESCNPSTPGKSHFFVGLGKCIGDLKELLLEREVSVVGVHSIGGGGKTTLALALSDDPQINDYFKNNVILITVSQSPNLKEILETMWEKIIGTKKSQFHNVEDGHIQLQQHILVQSKATLMILDDVWSRENLEKLLFEGIQYKTLVTTRDSSTIPTTPFTRLYQLPSLGQVDALSLFCFWAFGQTTIPNTLDENLVKEVQTKCGGLPLALKVIGSSLHGQSYVTWESAKNQIFKGGTILDYHNEGLLRCLEPSIDLLDDIVKECFLDLGLFPKGKKLSVDVLLDIWVNVRKLEWQHSISILLKLATRNLLNLTKNTRNKGTLSYGITSELYFSQHDVIHDLSLYLGCQDNIFHRKRLFMPRREHGFLEEWKFLSNKKFDAQMVSIHTGHMDETQWHEIKFPKAEVLVLLFSASEYFLPPFLTSMKKLKTLIISNYSSKRATVKGLDVLSSLSQIKVIRLERLISIPIQNYSEHLYNLEKLSLSLCEGFGNTSTFISNNLRFFNLDHCYDLEELPASICHMPSAQIWSITNCHLVQFLPYNLGNMINLRVLRLSALPSLKELPTSIGKIELLEYLDISICEGLRKLPEEIGKLKKLIELDMRECSRLKRIPKTVCGLSSLKHVKCDEKIEKQWLQAKSISLFTLEVEIVEACFSLDWLDD